MAEEVIYDLDGRQVKFRIRKIKYGEWQKVMGSSGSGNVELLGNVTKSKIDTTRLTDELMKMAVSNDEKVDFHDLAMADGLDLQEKVLKLNGMSSDTFRPQ